MDDGGCHADIVANDVVVFLPVVPCVGDVAVVARVENLDEVATIRVWIDSVSCEFVRDFENVKGRIAVFGKENVSCGLQEAVL